MKITIGIPAYNEEKNIASIITKLKNITDSIIVCNDGSSDLTGKIAEDMGAMIITHEKNMGYGTAINSIFKKSNEIHSDILVTFDGDGQHRIEDIKKILKPIQDNEADIVIGSRFLGKTKNLPKYRKFGIKTITGLTNVMTGSNITDSQSGFRAYSQKVLQEISPTESGMGISTEILIKATNKKMRITEIPITISYENNTHSKEPISHGTSVIISTVKHVVIERPLLYYGISGLFFLGIGLIFGMWALQIYSEQQVFMTNVALIGICGIILGTILLISGTILFSISTLINNNK